EPVVILRVDLLRTTYTTTACSSKPGRRWLRTRTATFGSNGGRAAQVFPDRDESYGVPVGQRAMSIIIRPETNADHEAIRHVNRLAFGQDDEARLVDALREGGFVRLSLVAEQGGQVVGHILFSDLPIITEAGTVPALALAPMAVLPEFQKRGIGSALVRGGLDECRQKGHKIGAVVGHPHFYPRFGFSPKMASALSSTFGGGGSGVGVGLGAG